MQIAKMNALLTATASGFSRVFSDAGKSVTSFSSQMASVGAKISAIGGAIGAGAAVYQIVSLTKASFESIDTLKDQAEAIGVSTEALSRLQYAAQFAGVDAGTMSGAVGKMVKILGDAALNGGEVANALTSVGLSASELSSMQPDQAFAKIAGALAKVENPYQRATLASQIFGKQWQSLIPILNKGEAGLNRLGIESDRFGFTVNTIDAAKVEAAADAFDRVSSMITGAANAAAIELAPYLEAVANQLVEIGMAGGGMGSMVTTAIEGVAKGIAYAADYLELFKAGWYLLEAGVLAVAGGLIKSIDYVGQGLVSLMNLLPGVNIEWTSSFSDMADSFANDVIAATDKAGAAFDKFSSGENSAKVGAFFDDVRKKADEAAKAQAEKPKPMSGLVNTDEQDKVIEDQKKAYEKLKSEAERYYEATRTPAEKYAAEIEKINELLLAGVLDKDTAQRAADAAATTLKDATKTAMSEPVTLEAPQLLQAGSAAAASFVAKIGREQQAQDQQKEMVAEQKTANDTLEAIRAANEKLADSLALVELI